jgi:hypothetical protein
MTKTTRTADEREWDANREARRQWALEQTNRTWREVESGDGTRPVSAIRRRLFPWRIRMERLS